MPDWKYFGVTHALHTLCNPLSSEQVDGVIDLLDLPDGARVLDIACGKAEVLCRIAERYPTCTTTGVDLSEWEVPAARKRVAERGLAERIAIEQGNGAEHNAPAGHYHLTSCLGASWIWNGHRGTLQALLNWTAPGGLVLAGEPYWIQPPPADRIAESEDVTAEMFGTHVQNVEAGESLGLRPIYATTSDLAAWDHYEWLQSVAADRWAAANPDDPDRERIMAEVKKARDEYMWQRDYLGWAVYLFRKLA